MRMRDLMKIVETTDQGWRSLLVFGSFSDPATGKNFFVMRIPEGRVPWSRKIVPAIDKLVRNMFSDEERQRDINRRRMGREAVIHWNVEGDDEGKSLWDLQQAVSRYEWDGATLVRMERS